MSYLYHIFDAVIRGMVAPPDNYIIFGQAKLYGPFGFKFYSDYHLNSIYIYYCCIWLVAFCYVCVCVFACISTCTLGILKTSLN